MRLWRYGRHLPLTIAALEIRAGPPFRNQCICDTARAARASHAFAGAVERF